ncbi:hypothetical protein HMSSN139_38050 [Paenibacillus sp. HMSSN-139]|nr:hypothetical protein HMSSN139_38050 [Paenibacillus sp. HMSSN-139]
MSSGRCVMDMSDNNKLTTGVLILAAGVIILLGKLGVFSFLGRALWPLLLLIPGIVLHVWHFWRKGPAELLLPGAILVVYSLVFFTGVIGGWQTLKFTWPLFSSAWPSACSNTAISRLSARTEYSSLP